MNSRKRCWAFRFLPQFGRYTAKEWIEACKVRREGLCCVDCEKKGKCIVRCNYSWPGRRDCGFFLTDKEAFFKRLFR